MPTPSFPSAINPVISRGYSFGTSKNIISIDTMGGAPIQVREFRTAPVLFNVTVVGSVLIKQVMTDFIYGKINSGADKFYMNLDSGMGVEQHICQMVPDSISFDGSDGPIWAISFQVRAESTPAQESVGSIVDMFEVYGYEIETMFDSLNQFVNVELPVYF